MKVKSLFVIAKDELFLKMLDVYYKKTGVEIFTISNIDESLHFIADLNPQYILVKNENYSEEELSLLKEKNISFITLGNNEISGYKFIKLPINPAQLLETLESI